MNKKNIILSFFVLGFFQSWQVKGQDQFLDGQKAEFILALVKNAVSAHNKTDSYGNTPSSYWTWDVKYKNGVIVDVIRCCPNQLMLDLKRIASFCSHYIMSNGKVSYTISQFEDVSTDILRKGYNNNNSLKKIGDFYFDNDYTHYQKIYLANNGLASVECRKTVFTSLPEEIQNTIKLRLSEREALIKNEDNQKNKYWRTRDSIRERAIRLINPSSTSDSGNYKIDLQSIKDRVTLIESSGISGIYEKLIFCKIRDNDKLIEVKNNQWPERIKATYNILKTPSGKICSISETPYDEHQTGNGVLTITHYFDDDGKLFAFVRSYIDYTRECYRAVSIENVCEYYDTHFSKISKTREVTDSEYILLDGSKCASPEWVEKYKPFPTVESLLKSIHK